MSASTSPSTITNLCQVGVLNFNLFSLAINIIDTGRTLVGKAHDERAKRFQSLFDLQREAYIDVIERTIAELDHAPDAFLYHEHTRQSPPKDDIEAQKRDIRGFYEARVPEFLKLPGKHLPAGRFTNSASHTVTFADNFEGELPRPKLSLCWLPDEECFKIWKRLLPCDSKRLSRKDCLHDEPVPSVYRSRRYNGILFTIL